VTFVTVAIMIPLYSVVVAVELLCPWETDMNNETSELNTDELDAACGGLKWDHDYVSKDVIDARGGSVTFMGLTFTMNANGKMSSIS
jgi:hypothetical protein